MSDPLDNPITTEAELNQAIAYVDSLTTPGTYTISLGAVISEGTDTGAPIVFNSQTLAAPADLYALNLASGVTVVINGNNFALDGQGAYRGLLVYAGSVIITDLTIENAVAVGGDGSGRGGGGAGLGGGLFVAGATQGAGGANVTVQNVTFQNDGAKGGAGGQSPAGSYGGGGGLGGDASVSGGGGGGVGDAADAGSGGAPGNQGVVLGAAGGGDGTISQGGSYGGGGGGNGTGSGGGGGGGVAGGNVRGHTGGEGGFGGGGGSDGGGGGVGKGGKGGFGGGGGAGRSLDGGVGGFGGGGGNAALGGFGGGAGNAATGGGGLGAGGDVFVQSGGTLIIEGGSLGLGALAAGTGAQPGGAYGDSMFLQGDEVVTLAPDVNTTLTISGVIADQSGSDPSTSDPGAGALIINGPGTVALGATNDFIGGVTIKQGSLALDAAGAAGSGTIAFAGQGSLSFDIGTVPTNVIAGFDNSDTIDIADLPFATTGSVSVNYDTNVVSIPFTASGGGTVSLQFDPAAYLPNDTFSTASDGHGGTALTVDVYSGPNLYVGTEQQLNQAIATVDSAITGNFTIVFAGNITEGTDKNAPINYLGQTLSAPPDLYAINLADGVHLTIEGNQYALDGANLYRGLFVYAGQVAINNLTIENAAAVGGAGGSVAGGGAGLGGGLFVAGTTAGGGGGGIVTINNVAFVNDSATGGAGGGDNGIGGGGGLGGPGGTSAGGGGGGIGLGAYGGAQGETESIPGPGIVLGVPTLDRGNGLYGGGGYGGTVVRGFPDPGNGGGVNSSTTGQTGGFGGGGGGYSGNTGGPGGFGGGGGGGAQSSGGAGGFGGGGGAGAAGGFGGGAGVKYEDKSGGGGGLGAGGDIFVQQGGSLIVEGGTLTPGTVHAGAGGGVAADGSAYGNGIFIQGNQSIDFTPAVGQTIAVTGVIADETGSHDASKSHGAGTVTLDGPGTLILAAENDYSGETALNRGTLVVGSAGATGISTITFSNADTATLKFTRADVPNSGIAAFADGDKIDITDLAYTSGASTSLNYLTDQLSVISNGQTAMINLAGNYAGDTFNLSSDGSGGTNLTVDVYTGPILFVGNEAQLNQAIAFVDARSAGSFTIKFAADIAEGTDTGAPINYLGQTLSAPADLYALNLASGVSVTIDGAGHALDGANTYRGFLVYSGNVTLSDLTIENAVAVGGQAGLNAGGGAGLGGGLFVAGPNPIAFGSGTSSAPATVTLQNVNFVNDSAVGGHGGEDSGDSGGGGGLGGAGGSIGGGGGVGFGAAGYNTSTAGAGVILGARSGGGTSSGPYGGGGGTDGAGGGVGGDANSGGNGGFGGGGGPLDHNAGDGGFGGGGGAGDYGNGGFGGGGGTHGNGGFGGGAGAGDFDGGGGGLGAGGDIFVQQGATLIIQGGTLDAGTVTPGHGGHDGDNGQAYGDGIFIQGNQSLTLTPGAGRTMLISGVIADMTGSHDPSGQTGAGSLIVNGTGTVTLDATNTFTGGIIVESGTLVLGAVGAAGSGPVTFADGDPPVLKFTIGNAPTNTMYGLTSADICDVSDLQTSATQGILGPNNVLYVPYSNGGGGTLQLAYDPDQDFSNDVFRLTPDGTGGTRITLEPVVVPCFVTGTRIRTDRGDVRVEDIRVGDTVQTLIHAEYQTVIWTGRRSVDCGRHKKPQVVWPVRVRAHAFGPDLPNRDLWLSPDHAIYIAHSLIPVKHLINGTTIAQVPVDRVTYHHIELAQHDVILSENLPSESYLDVNDRARFSNGGVATVLHPDFSEQASPDLVLLTWEARGCAPLALTGPALTAARQILMKHVPQSDTNGVAVLM